MWPEFLRDDMRISEYVQHVLEHRPHVPSEIRSLVNLIQETRDHDTIYMICRAIKALLIQLNG